MSAANRIDYALTPDQAWTQPNIGQSMKVRGSPKLWVALASMGACNEVPFGKEFSQCSARRVGNLVIGNAPQSIRRSVPSNAIVPIDDLDGSFGTIGIDVE